MLSRDFLRDRIDKITFAISQIAPGQTPNDSRLEPYAAVIGVVVNGVARAYPLEQLQTLHRLTDNLGGATIELRYAPTTHHVQLFIDDQPLSVQQTWWLGWYEFHPDTSIWQPPNGNI